LIPAWDKEFPTERGNYWNPYILEGIHMAAKIMREAKLSGKKVETT